MHARHLASHSRPVALLKRSTNGNSMPDRQQTYAKVLELIGPFNNKGAAYRAQGWL